MFNLNDTRHESGIILYGGNTVGVCNWMSCGENEIPMLSPFGDLLNVPLNVEQGDQDQDLVHIERTDDIRHYIPGSVWLEDDEISTDMDVVYDYNLDLAALFGFGPSAPNYEGIENPYSGDIWGLPDGKRVITIDFWN